MKRKPTSVFLATLMCVSLCAAAEAANRKAQQMVAGALKDQATLLAKYPALSRIDGVIRSDCAARNPGKLATDDFCGCAAAITTGLWRSGVDPNMVPRLTEYLKNPTDAAATSFLQYQGPELYRPICAEAARP